MKGGKARPFFAGDQIASYEFTARRAADITTVPWDLVIFDEAHRLKSAEVKLSQVNVR